MSKQATNLIDAYNNFYFQEPIVFENAPGGSGSPVSDPTFYVERPDNTFNKLLNSLLYTNHPEKYLFSGHKGSGKSTELNRLAANKEIRENFFVIKYSVQEELDLSDIQHTDFLVALGIQIYLKLADNNIKLNEKTNKKLEEWKNSLEKTLETEKNIGGEVGAEIRIPLLNIKAKIRMERVSRQKIRKEHEPQLKILMELIQEMITDASIAISPKRLLLIIEDIDKIYDLDMIRNLFYSAGTYLAAPNCNAIYTIPISFHYDEKYTSVISTIGPSLALPNVKLWERADPERKITPSGFEIMRGFVAKRMSLGLIEDGALDEAVRNSGGMMREMGQIMHRACILAITMGLDKITKTVIDNAIGEIRQDYSGFLAKTGVYELLDSIEINRIPIGDELSLKLLNSKHILEFVNGENDRWHDVNHIVIPLLKRWRAINKKEGKCVPNSEN